MKSKKTPATFAGHRLLLPPLFGLFVFGRAADAQQETIQPLAPPVESISQLNMTNSFDVFGPRPAATAPMPYEPFRWDQFVARPHADYQFVDATGLLAAPSNRVDTTIQEISPGILFNLGPHWALDYTLNLDLYSNTNFGTEVDNSVTLTGQTVYNDWVLGFLQSIDFSKSALIETAGQLSEQNYDTAVTGHHEDSQYISEDLAFYQSIQETGGGFENMRSWSTLDWLNYEPQSRFLIGIGPGLGYDNADYGPDSVFEELQARMNWRATDKLSFQLNGGANETEFLGGQGNGDLFSPVYGAQIQYQPFSATQISLFANRTVAPSVLVGEYGETTALGASLTQRFFRQFYVSLGASYDNQKYVASSLDVSANRVDKYYSLTARLSHSFIERGTISIFYERDEDSSSAPGYSFNSNQFGAEVSYSF